MSRYLDKNGNIEEPCSKRYGLPPDTDIKREKMLLWSRWVWLILLPFLGIIAFFQIDNELTDRWGHKPFWVSK